MYSEHRVIIGTDDLLMLGRDVIDDEGNVVISAEDDLLRTQKEIFMIMIELGIALSAETGSYVPYAESVDRIVKVFFAEKEFKLRIQWLGFETCSNNTTEPLVHMWEYVPAMIKTFLKSPSPKKSRIENSENQPKKNSKN